MDRQETIRNVIDAIVSKNDDVIGAKVKELVSNTTKDLIYKQTITDVETNPNKQE